MININLKEAVFSTEKVVFHNNEILYVYLDDEGWFSFLGYEENEILDSEIKIVSLGSIIQKDPSVINAILNLDLQQRAYRDNKKEEWIIENLID